MGYLFLALCPTSAPLSRELRNPVRVHRVVSIVLADSACHIWRTFIIRGNIKLLRSRNYYLLHCRRGKRRCQDDKGIIKSSATTRSARHKDHFDQNSSGQMNQKENICWEWKVSQGEGVIPKELGMG